MGSHRVRLRSGAPSRLVLQPGADPEAVFRSTAAVSRSSRDRCRASNALPYEPPPCGSTRATPSTRSGPATGTSGTSSSPRADGRRRLGPDQRSRIPGRMPDPVVIAAESGIRPAIRPRRGSYTPGGGDPLLHGAGGYADDQVMADAIRAALDEPVHHSASARRGHVPCRVVDPDLGSAQSRRRHRGRSLLRRLDALEDADRGRPRRRAARASRRARLGTGRLGRGRLRAAPRPGPPAALRPSASTSTTASTTTSSPSTTWTCCPPASPAPRSSRHRHGGHQFEGDALEAVARTLR